MNAGQSTADRVQELIDLQLEFTAATEEMNRLWVAYRDARPDAAALDAYTTATERCEALKSAIYQFKTAGRAA